MNSFPTAALFDIGNVLVHLDFESALRDLIPPGVADPEERMQSLLEKRDEFETGALSTPDFVAWASDRLGFSGPPARFHDAWNSIFAPIHTMWSIASFLKSQRVRIILFSNTNAIHADWLLANYEIFEQFDAQVFSHEVGAIKPDPAIYHHAVARHDLVPAETLYIDDLPANIATGAELGFRTHQYAFAKHHEFIAWLDRELGVG